MGKFEYALFPDYTATIPCTISMHVRVFSFSHESSTQAYNTYPPSFTIAESW